jgi:hypothetical protein
MQVLQIRRVLLFQLTKSFAPYLSSLHYRFFCDKFGQWFVKRLVEVAQEQLGNAEDGEGNGSWYLLSLKNSWGTRRTVKGSGSGCLWSPKNSWVTGISQRALANELK